MKILIVDDIPANRRVLRAVLETTNFEVVEAEDGAEALEVMEAQAVDAIISDVLMPRMDGYRLCQEVRHDQRWRQIPFIFYTATYTSGNDEKHCYALGGNKFLRKPAPAEALLTALGEATIDSKRNPFKHQDLVPDVDEMKEYSEHLVRKLEETNQELITRTDELERARAELKQANSELESRIRERTLELQAANKELESFSYSVSHDLRAPVRHISGFASILLRNCRDKLDAANLKYLENVSNAALHMGELITALLNLSQIARAQCKRTSVDLSAMAGEIGGQLQGAEPDRTVRLEIEAGLKAEGDPDLLRIVLRNLLENAWKYSRKQPEARVEFGKVRDEAAPSFFVRDNGAGFNPNYAQNLFTPFQRLHSDRDFEGIGIGLATVHRIINRHHGKIRGESVNHQGATFYFTLPGDAPNEGKTAV